MKRCVVFSLMLVACIVITGCAAKSGEAETGVSTPAEVSTLLASLDDGETSSLDHVSLSASQGGSIDADAHEDDLLQSGYARADIGVFDEAGEIETKLVIPMWYGDSTTIQVKGGEPLPMPEAVEEPPSLGKQAYWFGDPVVSVEFHMEDGVLVLDKIVVPRT